MFTVTQDNASYITNSQTVNKDLARNYISQSFHSALSEFHHIANITNKDVISF